MSTQSDIDRDFITRSVRWGITLAVAVALGVALLWLLKSALTPLVSAFALAYFLDPLIDRFEARRVPRPIAIFFLVVVSVVVAFMTAFFVIPKLSQEIGDLGERLPGYLDDALVAIVPRVETWFGISLPSSIREALDALQSGGVSIPFATLGQMIERTAASITGTLGALVGLVVIPFIAYYALAEFDRIRTGLMKLVPVPYQDAVATKLAAINDLIAGFIRGQLIVCALLGALYAIGFSIIGIDLALMIGLISGLLAIIPYVGGAVALTAAAAMCLLQFGIDQHLALVVGWYALVQTLEGLVLTPRIVGHTVGIHPVTVIVGLLIGGDLLGFLGLLVAVPTTAVVQVFVKDLLEVYWNSPLYTSGLEPGD
jgi:predicted PurR-regulated permease PerM